MAIKGDPFSKPRARVPARSPRSYAALFEDVPPEGVERQGAQAKLNTKVETKPKTKLETKVRTELETKVETTRRRATLDLEGLQLRLVRLLVERARSQQSRLTGPLTFDEIVAAVGHPASSVRTSIARLVDKQYVTRARVRNGRHGWTDYRVASKALEAADA